MADSNAGPLARSGITAKTVGVVGFAIHLVSWFSPVHREVHTGWEAFKTCWPGIWTMAVRHEEVTVVSGLEALSPHTNYVVVVACILLMKKNPPEGWLRWTGWLLIASVLCDAVWFTEGSALRFGYYLWLVSFAMLAWAVQIKLRDA